MLKKTILLLSLVVTGAAQAGVVVVGNPASPELDASTIKKIYLGKAKSLNIEAIDLEDGHALKSEFHSAVTGKTEAQLQAFWAKKVFTGKGQPPKTQPSTALVKSAVAGSTNSIGYIDESDVDSSVKVLLRP
ncbi:putative exported protein [Aliivibrio wodanis]|uniref:Putative exported protein n=1 Tax=Aliivibrio wodanis TaxID=80852 RepID=A0A090IPC0_9GAMM|nr:putative exported protein [Aliivibrio wodanis]VVV02729.1 hypothetical protein AW0309160_00054 [Aliivibrio wodanis]